MDYTVLIVGDLGLEYYEVVANGPTQALAMAKKESLHNYGHTKWTDWEVLKGHNLSVGRG